MSAEVLGAAAWAAASHEGQRAPAGDWRTWVFLGGRGAGKTRAGAEWVWATACALGAGGRIALVAPTLHDARAVMVEGPSGVLNLPFRSGAVFEPSLRRVRFPGGALGLLFSAEEPERLRGPQFHAAWGDEVCAWGRGEEVLAMLRLGLRLEWPVRASDSLVGRGPSAPSGTSRPDAAWASPHPGAQAASDRVASGSAPQLVLTSTPKPGRLMRGVLGEVGCVRTDAGTRANAANLAPGFLAAMEDLYGGTRRAAQELEGKLLEAEGALFRHEDIERARAWGESYVGPCERVVVAVDPPAGTLSGRPRDACGIVAAGRLGDRFVVLEDRTAAGLSPEGWADRVRRTAEAHKAAKVVVEANQGGAMCEAVLKACGLTVPVRRVHASLGKAARAEPVAALYEQGRVAHLPGPGPGLEALEEELMGLGSEGAGGGSPDRADALVWAITELMRPRRRPGVWVL
ncbi:terminase large subunit domain-containing protein [Brevundimonas lenta]|uniref:Phage terminase large subunit-like protein n=1 Tax=Brevundimonas lenta TaxID=424796 RepID=A0A7W6JBW4_9CAUL|nr:terminase family protein [Brevundimonas lenta]MBB4081328.1 phage terminase large subunit-like protein [Brevundimonas lenta]